MPRDGIFSKTKFASFVCLGFLLLASPVVYGQTSPPRDAAEAWKWMQEALESAGISKAQLNNGVVTGEVKSGPFSIHLESVISIDQPSYSVTGRCDSEVLEWHEFPNRSSSSGAVRWTSFAGCGAEHKAQRFQAALIYLARQAQQEQETKDAADLEAFKPKAAAWRQLAVKPEIPEEALRHQVLAEYAYKQKDVPKAIAEYTEALRIFPYWPAGQNNLAFLAGEVGTRPGYNLAIHHMKMYLELAPNAPDAQAAQDSIFIWEDKRTTATP